MMPESLECCMDKNLKPDSILFERANNKTNWGSLVLVVYGNIDASRGKRFNGHFHFKDDFDD